MRVINNKTIKMRCEHRGQVISDYVLENCTFESWASIAPKWSDPDPKRRTIVRNVTLRNTNALHGEIEGAILEDIVVDTVKGGRHPIFLRGNAYRHVVFKGRITRIEIRKDMFPMDFPENVETEIIKAWNVANAAYYKDVDWAIDITEASFASFTIQGIPTKLIRRSPENTAVVTRRRALAKDFRRIPMNSSLYQIVIDHMLDNGDDDVLLIACPRASKYKEDLEDLQILRDAGIAR